MIDRIALLERIMRMQRTVDDGGGPFYADFEPIDGSEYFLGQVDVDEPEEPNVLMGLVADPPTGAELREAGGSFGDYIDGIEAFFGAWMATDPTRFVSFVESKICDPAVGPLVLGAMAEISLHDLSSTDPFLPAIETARKCIPESEETLHDLLLALAGARSTDAWKIFDAMRAMPLYSSPEYLPQLDFDMKEFAGRVERAEP